MKKTDYVIRWPRNPLITCERIDSKIERVAPEQLNLSIEPAVLLNFGKISVIQVCPLGVIYQLIH